jgi:hypothetical protein
VRGGSWAESFCPWGRRGLQGWGSVDCVPSVPPGSHVTLPLPDMEELADARLPTGECWILRAGGTRSDYYTFLLTIHPDGHRDEGGMGGPPLYAGSLMNTYTGGSERGTRRILVRADPQVAWVRVELGSGEQADLAPVAARPDLGLVFFATLLPPPAALVSVAAIGEDGQVLETQDLSGHEAAWQRFQWRQGHTGA